MPSKGTKTFAVRLPPELVQRVQGQIDSRNTWSPEAPWTLSDFIRVCLERELKKMARSRMRRGRRPTRADLVGGLVVEGSASEGEA